MRSFRTCASSSTKWIALLLFYGAMARAQHVLPDSACAGCHPAETRLHEHSRMAKAMIPALASGFARDLPARPLRETGDGYEYEFRAVEKGLEVTATKGPDRAQGTIEWVLGAGAQGETPLVATANGTRESHLSFFPNIPQYGITIGQHATPSETAQSALGRLETHDMLLECLSCHATAVSRDLEPLVPGIQCQRCHAGAEAHVQNPALHRPVNPGKLSAHGQVEFCGTCHRLQVPGQTSGAAEHPENVRFQPYRLAMSRCYASNKLECTTCHPAHVDARRNDNAFYNDRCTTCHTTPHTQGDCVSCHMPRVHLNSALVFTDHYIR